MAELEDLDQKIHKMDKGKWIGVGIGFVTLIIVYLAYKRNQANNAATANASQSPTLSSIDPTTGVPYSSELPSAAGAMTPGSTSDSQFQSILSALSSQDTALTNLTQALTNPSPTPTSATAGQSYDYSQLGPDANQIVFAYNAAGVSPDIMSIVGWENGIRWFESQGQSEQQATANAESQIWQRLQANNQVSAPIGSAVGMFPAPPTAPAGRVVTLPAAPGTMTPLAKTS